MFLYLNASIAGALLQPLLELQASGTNQSSAAQDIGDVYPVVSRPDIVPQQGVERECLRLGLWTDAVSHNDVYWIFVLFRVWEHAHHGAGVREDIGRRGDALAIRTLRLARSVCCVITDLNSTV